MEKLLDHEETLGGIVADMKSTDTKTSAIENIKKVSLFEKSTKKRRRVIAAETKSEGVHITPAVGKRRVIIFLGASKPGHAAALDAELTARNIILDELLIKMKWRLKLELLKKHEIGILVARPEGATVGGKAMTWRDVKDECVPQTNELKALLTAQSQWQANKRKCSS